MEALFLLLEAGIICAEGLWKSKAVISCMGFLTCQGSEVGA